MRRLAIAISLCLTAVLPLHAAITGTLINSDGQPVAGAKVSIYPLELPDAAMTRLTSASPERTPIASATSDSKGRFSIPSPKESLDGSKVYPYYRAGKLAEIIEYCKRDVDSTRQVYRRLTFTNGPGPAV